MSEDLSDAHGVDIPLSQMLQSLRRELNVAMKASREERLRFELTEVELELEVGISRNKSAGGQIEFKVFGFGGGIEGQGEQSLVHNHVFKLKLRPIMEGTTQSVLIDDTVSSDELE